MLAPGPQKTGTPIWASIIMALCGCLVLSSLMMAVFGLKIGGPDSEKMRSNYASANPDFEVLEYSASKQLIHVRHKATRREFNVGLAALSSNASVIDYRGLATKVVQSPDWLHYPGAGTSRNSKELAAFFKNALEEKDFSILKQGETFVESCNPKTIECAVVWWGPQGDSDKDFFGTAYRIVPPLD